MILFFALSSPSIVIEELAEPKEPTSSSLPIASKKKRLKRVSSDLPEDISKKTRTPISPGLRLSNTYGGRRGGRGGRGRVGGQGKSLGLGRGKGNISTRSISNLSYSQSGLHDTLYNSLGGETAMGENCDTIGMKDLTHLQGCGGWPSAAARFQ